MKIAVVLFVAMIMMMGQETEGWRRWRRWRIRLPKAIAVYKILGKREDADLQAKYKAAAEDGEFTDEEIKSVFGVDENGLADFKKTYDMDGDGVIQVEEYEAVEALSASMQEEEEEKKTKLN